MMTIWSDRECDGFLHTDEEMAAYMEFLKTEHTVPERPDAHPQSGPNVDPDDWDDGNNEGPPTSAELFYGY